MSTAKTLYCALFLTWLCAFVSLSNAGAPPVVPSAQAASHVGEQAIVEGVVANVFTSDKGTIFLNFGAAYPLQHFSATVFADFTDSFDDLHRLEGKRVRITGTIQLYRGKPQILLKSPDQLRVVD